MEHLTISHRTAKKLEAAGFPQEAIFYISNTGYGYNPHGGHVPDGTIAIPTAEEIADQLRIPGDQISLVQKSDGSWWASINRSDLPSIDGDTMAEALAALYVKFNSPEKENE